MKLVQRGKTLDIKKHNIGKSPNQTTLNNARKNLLHHTIYNRQRELLNYSGTPDRRRISSAYFQVNGGYSCEFYIIWPTRGTTGDKVRIGFNMTTWDDHGTSEGANCNFAWDGVSSDKLINKRTPGFSNNQTISYSLADIKKPNGLTVQDDIELDYNHLDFNGYSYTKVSFNHLQPASFVSWISSEYGYDFADDTVSDDKAFNLSDSTFNIGQVVRGRDGLIDGDGSVGTLCQRQFNDGTSGQNMINNSDLCMFQHGHPSGIYLVGSGALALQDVYGYKIKIRGRSLKDATSGKFDVAIVYRADSGTFFDVLVDSTGNNHNFSLLGTGSVTTSVALTDIPFDGSGDEINIRCAVSSTQAVEIKSIAVFEKTD